MKTQLKTLSDQAAWFDLNEWGVIKVTGDDRLSFLNGQLTQDMTTLSGNQTFLCAYCNPKGRVIALLRAFNTEDTLYLVTERTLVQSVIERLQKFIFRAKVVFTDVSDTLDVIGVQINPLPHDFPEDSATYSIVNGIILLRLEASQNRGWLIAPKGEAAATLEKLNLAKLSQAKESQWNGLDILQGLPRITTASCEKFLVQALNLDCLNGVSFTKGCYVGQEIVARMHYLGKNKQRMAPAILEGNAPNNGELIKGKGGEKIAEVVFTQINEGETLAQVVITNSETTDAALTTDNDQTLHIGSYTYLEQ